jgi:Zn-dependent peptidase ImmA (M78 family)
MPKPKKFLTDAEIEERSKDVLNAHVIGGSEGPKLPIDIDTLTEADFGFKVTWDDIPDPKGCRTFATLIPTPNEHYAAHLKLNSRFEEFLHAHPQIERLTRGHELAHWILHVDEGQLRSGTLPFGDTEVAVRFHRIQESDSSLSSELKNRLAKFALADERAYRMLNPRHDERNAWIEPQWMHRQAEHFSACLLVPRKPLLSFLDSGDDPAFYRTHVRLANEFLVSKRVIQIRLSKLRIIEEYKPLQFRTISGQNRLS